MAFSYANAAGGGQSSGGPTMRDGPELQEIFTDQLGFAGLNPEAETQIRLIPEPWPADALPPPSASLLAVASSRGIVAAAGPNHLVLATTASVRKALVTADEKKIEKLRPFEPQIKIPKPRLGHVVFSSDDNVLVISSQDGGGLEAYQISAILDGQTEPALQLSTNGIALGALVPNPNPAQDTSGLFGAVTIDGELLLADLGNGNITPSGRSGVSCLSWSNKGKQLVAGLANGTAVQLKPDGTLVAEIPKSTAIPDGYHVSGISWLENDSFFIIYTPNETTQGIMPSEYYIVSRRPKSQDFTFQKLPEIVQGFGMERIPTYHFMSRLRNFPPHIQDLLVVSATSGSDISLISKSDKPLSEDGVIGNFAFTVINNDTRRAQLPLSAENQMDTSPIGMALDLSSKDSVPRPLPSDPEIEETSGPCPNILVLNNEGILLSWWLIYTDSVKEKTTFSGFETPAPNSQTSAQPAVVAATTNQADSTPASAFGQPGFASAKPFASASSTFGAPGIQSSQGNTFGSAFGQSSTIGNANSSWASTGFGNASSGQTSSSGFGQTAFGSASALGGSSTPAFGSASAIGGSSAPAFGSAGALGSKPAFGHPSQSSTPAFGKPSFEASGSTFGSNAPKPSPFGANASQSSGFASFSNKGGFGAFGASQDQGTSSPFSKPSGESPFGKPATGGVFGGFGSSDAESSKSAFGSRIGGIKIQSSFKGDGTAKDDGPKPKEPSGFGFGTGLDDMLKDSPRVTSPTHDKEEDMEEGEIADDSASENSEKPAVGGPGTQQPPRPPPQNLVTPPSTLGQPKAKPAPPVSNLFGMSNDQTTTPAPTTSTGFSFGQVPTTTPKDTPTALPSTTPKDTPFPPQKMMFGTTAQSDKTPAAVQNSQPNSIFSNIPKLASEPGKSAAQAPRIKEEPPSDDEGVDLRNIPPAPLPPDTTSKARYVSGNTSASSNNSKTSAESNDDAPLPPDFVPANKSAAPKAEEQGLPSEDESALSDGFEDSGEDVEDDISQIEEPTEDGLEVPSEGQADHIQTSPESSFKSGDQSQETSPTGGLFTKVSTNATQKPMRPLFGEVGSTGPILPPPKPHESPRSPSPVRRLPPAAEALRSESARSVSAPAHGRASPSMIDKRRAEAASSTAQAQSRIAEEMARQKAQQAALTQQKAQQEAKEFENLQDDEDERLRRELEAPISASESLPQFITYQSKPIVDGPKSGVPAQIERLYQDINCMIDTLGINARALTAFMQYQHDQEPNETWPAVLNSDTPRDALNDEWVLGDIPSLREGQDTLERRLNNNQIDDVASKLQQCHTMLGQEIVELKTKLASIRKTLHAKHTSESIAASSLSAEQSSIQQDLRKASASVHGKLGQVEDSLGILRAKLAEAGAIDSEPKRTSLLGRSSSQKKPTVEAVMNTITKMTTMAEKKSADIDVLEAQLRKLDMSGKNGIRNGNEGVNGTPKNAQKSLVANTPGSGRSSIYHTPDSKFGGSVKSTPSRKSANGDLMIIAAEDREMWQAKARRKKEAAAVLRTVLAERRKQGTKA